MSPAKKVTRSKDGSQLSLGKESDGGQQKKQAAAKPNLMGRGGFDAYWGPQGGEQAGPSHEGWPTLQQSAGVAGVKRTAPSQSPKKTALKEAHQIQVQQRIQQQALQPAPAHVSLLSALAGTPKSFETTKKSLAAGNDEWEHLNQEMRAGQALFTEYGLLGTSRAMLTQPAQPTGIAELLVPWIRADELHLRNAGVSLREHAMAQNRIYFVQWEQQPMQPTMPTEVAQLVTALSGQLMQQMPLPQKVPPPTAQQQPGTAPPQPTDEPSRAEGMETDVQEKDMGQSDEQMDDRAGVHGSGSTGLTEDTE